jgi:hypothetical protein
MSDRRRGLRGKQRRDADDRAVERAAAEARRREAALAIVNESLDAHDESIDTLDEFRTRDAGFAGTGHQHGADDINSVHWGRVGTGQSPVPNFAKQSDLADLRQWALNTFKKQRD